MVADPSVAAVHADTLSSHVVIARTTESAIQAMTRAQPVWRQNADGSRVVTDNGNVILDIHGLSIVDPVGLEQAINQIPGVVSVGLFARRPADVVIVGGEPPIVL